MSTRTTKRIRLRAAAWLAGFAVAGSLAVAAETPPVAVVAPDPSPSPLIERPRKETFSVLTDFQESLQTGAYREACQAITKSAAPGLQGVVPSPHDPRLLVSLPAALKFAMQDDAALVEAMRAHFATLGHLRLKRAIAADNAALVEAVTVQFCMTEAAAEAHAWLADRELSGGRSPQAAGHYRRALEGVSAARKAELEPRLRLAGAMHGEDIGKPPAATVAIGPQRLSPPAFEQLVRRLRESASRADPADKPAKPPTAVRRPAPPDAYQGMPWARFEPQEYGKPPNAPDRACDWAARQIGVAFSGSQMIVGNPFELAAYELESGKRQWVQRSDGDAPPGGLLLPMQPLVAGARVYVRSWTAAGPALLCRGLGDGRLLWKANPEYVVSDPLLVGQSLLALTIRKDSALQVSLLLTEFQARTGNIISNVPLAEFHTGRGYEWDRFSCQATAADDRIVATLAGCVLCCDLSGRVLWIRRQPWTAPPPSGSAASASYWRQRHAPPLVCGGRALAAQPGVAAVECLDIGTGRLLWRAAAESPAPLGCIGTRLIVATGNRFAAVDIETGEVLWLHAAGPRFEGILCSQRVGLLYIRQTPADGPNNEVRGPLVTVDPKTGQARGESALNLPRQGETLLGPLVARGDRLWAFVSAGNPTTRDIVELRPNSGKSD